MKNKVSVDSIVLRIFLILFENLEMDETETYRSENTSNQYRGAFEEKQT